MEKVSRNIFDKFVNSGSIVTGERKALEPGFLPERLPHREQETDQLARILSPSLAGNRPSNAIIFGKPGVGKTSVVRFVENEMRKATESSIRTNVKIVDINCGVIDNSYGVLLAVGEGIRNDWEEKLPFTGWPLDRLYNVVLEKINGLNGIVIISLDEVDRLVKRNGDGVLYQLLRMNEELDKSRVSLIGISNDLRFTEYLDPRVKSRLVEETIVFNPYNASQIYDILEDRVIYAGISDSIEDSALKVCAALAAQEHGDARRAIDLLKVAVELVEMSDDKRITEEIIYSAKSKLERDVVADTVATLPLHSKLVLFSATLINEIRNGGKSTTGELYDLYIRVCERLGISNLTQRRIADIVNELSSLGLLNSEVMSFGRYGRTTTIMLNYDQQHLKDLLMKDELISQLKDVKPLQKSLPVS
ncbi:MAG: orc1/cdc6 family replication initiation protein [Thermoplasmatales archaeon]